MGLARLTAVLAALVGLAVMQTSPCADEAFVGHDVVCSTAGWGTSAVADIGIAASEVLEDREAAAGLPAVNPRAPQAPDWVLGLCVVALLSALLAVTWRPGPGPSPAVVESARSGPHPPPAQRRCHAPSLAMLCVLRT
ncbi:hypothetical protein ACW9G9_34785 [Nocardia asiatica]